MEAREGRERGREEREKRWYLQHKEQTESGNVKVSLSTTLPQVPFQLSIKSHSGSQGNIAAIFYHCAYRVCIKRESHHDLLRLVELTSE